MNIYRKGKHHIWTVVISKSRMFYLIVSFLCLAILISFLNLPENVEIWFFSPMAKQSVKSKFSSRDFATKKLPKPDIEGVLKASSPVFSVTHEAKKESFQVMQVSQKNETPKKTERVWKSIVSKNPEISNATSFSVDAKSLIEKNVNYKALENGSKVLIVHTHGCETYSTSDGTPIGDGGSYRTTDKNKNVTAIGKVIADELKKRGVSVIYDDTLCDYPAYNSSYKNSMELIEKYKKENPDIRFVFDIHRDAVADSNGKAQGLFAQVNGETCAQVMIVCGTDASGLYHPYWQENLTLGLKIQKKLEEKFPGLARPLNLREERFNMHETTGSLIFEVGTNGNTAEEAKKTAVFLAEGICEVICN